MSDLTQSRFYTGMGTLSIPLELREALDERQDIREQAKNQYGLHRENMLIDADNIFCLALEKYLISNPPETTRKVWRPSTSLTSTFTTEKRRRT